MNPRFRPVEFRRVLPDGGMNHLGRGGTEAQRPSGAPVAYTGPTKSRLPSGTPSLRRMSYAVVTWKKKFGSTRWVR